MQVIDYLTLLPVQKPRAELIKKMWRDRMHGTKRKVEVWQSILAVRMLVLPPTEDVDTWLKFASLCRKSMRDRQAHSTLVKLLQVGLLTDPRVFGMFLLSLLSPWKVWDLFFCKFSFNGMFCLTRSVKLKGGPLFLPVNQTVWSRDQRSVSRSAVHKCTTTSDACIFEVSMVSCWWL